MLVVLGPALVGFIVSLLCERLVRPPVRGPFKRPRASLLLHLGVWSLAFAVLVLLVQRPWLAAAILIAIELVVIQSSNAKWDSLQEPFVIDDFEYFVDAVRYPRLFVPFFGIGLAVGASIAVLATIALFLYFEPAIFAGEDAKAAAIAVAALALIGGLAIQLGRKRLPAPALAPREDLERLGLVGHFWAYAQQPRPPLPRGATTPVAFDRRPPDNGASQPDIVVVQNESFFDARRWSSLVNPGLLAHWDALVAQAEAHGRLEVPAWGANTARTEAAVLTGLAPQELGVDQFNPYRRLAREPVPNLAGTLREWGYETVVIHPYPAGFYGRDQVMKTMGFNRFIDIEAFSDADHDGQFVSDAAVARRLQQLMAEPRRGPLFVFIITIENHGPTHLERADAATPALRATLAEPDALPAQCNDLAVYLRHLANADAMLGTCRAALESGERGGVLAWYGDHVPILPEVYRRLGTPDGRSDYAIWTTDCCGPVAETPLRANDLAGQILDQAARMATYQREPDTGADDIGPSSDSREPA